MNQFEFVDELPPGTDSLWKRNRILREFAAELRSQRGRWAKYPFDIAESSLHPRASQVRRGTLAAFSDGKYEATVRAGQLYVRAVLS